MGRACWFWFWCWMAASGPNSVMAGSRAARRLAGLRVLKAMVGLRSTEYVDKYVGGIREVSGHTQSRRDVGESEREKGSESPTNGVEVEGIL